MNRALIRQALEAPTEENIEALLMDEDTILWVDWREEEDAIVRECAYLLDIDQITAEIEDVDNEAGFEMYILYGSKRVRVPLVIGYEDRHIALCSLNEALWPDYEVRYCIDSGASDTLGFLPLPMSDWRLLEREFGDGVDQLFYKLTPKPNLFTDPLPPELSPFRREEPHSVGQVLPDLIKQPSLSPNPDLFTYSFPWERNASVPMAHNRATEITAKNDAGPPPGYVPEPPPAHAPKRKSWRPWNKR